MFPFVLVRSVVLSRPEAGEPAGAKGQLGGLPWEGPKWLLAACGAPVGGAAKREHNDPGKRNGVAATNAGPQRWLERSRCFDPRFPHDDESARRQ